GRRDSNSRRQPWQGSTLSPFRCTYAILALTDYPRFAPVLTGKWCQKWCQRKLLRSVYGVCIVVDMDNNKSIVTLLEDNAGHLTLVCGDRAFTGFEHLDGAD